MTLPVNIFQIIEKTASLLCYVLELLGVESDALYDGINRWAAQLIPLF